MKEMNTCQICEQNEKKWKYTFTKKKLKITLEICEKCAETLLAENFNRYRKLERIEEVKTLKLKK